MPIKYLGSKRRLVDVIGAMFTATGGGRALDLFTGTTRVAQELKRQGGHVTAVDRARYAAVFAESAIATDADRIDLTALDRGARRAQRDAAAPGLRDRDVLPAGPLLPAGERRAHRRDP